MARNLALLGGELRNLLTSRIPRTLWRYPENTSTSLEMDLLADALKENPRETLETKMSALDEQQVLDAGCATIRNLRQCFLLLDRASFRQSSTSTTSDIRVTSSGIFHNKVPEFQFDAAKRSSAPNLAQLPYRISIENHSEHPVRLISRRWVITNLVDEEPFVVEGEGVVGKTPLIDPGDAFQYSSSTVCKSHTNMMGEYTFVRDGVPSFHVQIPAFSVWNWNNTEIETPDGDESK